jgi:hypothetical protein
VTQWRYTAIRVERAARKKEEIRRRRRKAGSRVEETWAYATHFVRFAFFFFSSFELLYRWATSSKVASIVYAEDV